jgi:hypothetical protein
MANSIVQDRTSEKIGIRQDRGHPSVTFTFCTSTSASSTTLSIVVHSLLFASSTPLQCLWSFGPIPKAALCHSPLIGRQSSLCNPPHFTDHSTRPARVYFNYSCKMWHRLSGSRHSPPPQAELHKFGIMRCGRGVTQILGMRAFGLSQLLQRETSW